MNIYKYYAIVLFIALIIMIIAFICTLVTVHKRAKERKKLEELFGKDLYD